MGNEFDGMFLPASSEEDLRAPTRGLWRSIALSILIWLVICLTLAVVFA
jgi:hypothetical protein